MKKRFLKRNSVALVLNRRKVLGFVGGTIGFTLFGCLRNQSTAIASTALVTEAPPSTATTPAGMVKPEQTEGPYFVD